jgi:hypothetical protein
MAPAFAGDAVAAWPEPTVEPSHEQTFAWQVVDAQGAVIKRSAHAPAQAFHAKAAPGYSSTVAWRILAWPWAGSSTCCMWRKPRPSAWKQ